MLTDTAAVLPYRGNKQQKRAQSSVCVARRQFGQPTSKLFCCCTQKKVRCPKQHKTPRAALSVQEASRATRFLSWNGMQCMYDMHVKPYRKLGNEPFVLLYGELVLLSASPRFCCGGGIYVDSAQNTNTSTNVYMRKDKSGGRTLLAIKTKTHMSCSIYV